MSGHSKWSTIKRAKGAADVRRGLTFTKLANAITIAAKLGGSGDANSNPRLRLSLDQARSVNMPKDNIQRAIDRGLGKLPGQSIEEVVYEGFGPGKVAFYLEGATDNKLRTLQEVRNAFERSGGNLGGSGSTSYMFNQMGEIRVRPPLASLAGSGSKRESIKDEEMLKLIDLGAEDVEDYLEEQEEKYLVYTKSPHLKAMSNKITQAGYQVESAELVMKPTIVTEIKDQETAKKVMEFAEKLENMDDIQKVYANFEIEMGS